MGTTSYLTTLFSRNDLTLRVIFDTLCCNNVEEVCLVFNDFFNDFINNDDIDSNVANLYHVFLYQFMDLTNNMDDLRMICLMLNSHIKAMKNILKDYNKNILDKDRRYYIITKIQNDMKASISYIEDLISLADQPEEYDTIAFIIFKLKKPDYVFRLIELNPDSVNVRDSSGNCIFVNMVEYVNSNIDSLSEEDIKYFKRLFVMFLESDKLKLSTEKLFDLLGYLEKNRRSLSVNSKKQVSFFINEIEKHYQVINGDARETVIDKCGKACPVEIIKRNTSDRVDLTHLFTVSIDKVAKDEVGNMLIDDALSLVEHNTGMAYDLYIHFPDVDHYVKKDSETDLFMRSIGENVYTRDYRTKMLPYEISSKCSLVSGSKRNAITLKILIDKDGKVLDIEFLKSIINVNYNLTTRKAEQFMKITSTYKDTNLQMTLNSLANLAYKIRTRRGEKKSKNAKANLIIEEYNVFADLIVADYFNKVGMVFPYRNFEGKRSGKTPDDLDMALKYIKEKQVSDKGIELINEVLLAYNRTYYDTVPKPNKSFKGLYSGNVGNPLREYISLETDRLIKDLIIAGQKNVAYWEERINRDCIEYTETSNRINQLRKTIN